MSELGRELFLTLGFTTVSLLVVWIPFTRGLELCLRAGRATRRLGPEELRRRLARPSEAHAEPLSVLMLRLLRKTIHETDPKLPRDFVLDATRQYVSNEFDTHYSRLISMYANLLPPIGFLGTLLGLLVLFLSLHLENESLELSALALALTSTVFALLAFTCLEALRTRLQTRLVHRLDEATAVHGELLRADPGA
jgi:biopolymer transport protein ExbB/TolQ